MRSRAEAVHMAAHLMDYSPKLPDDWPAFHRAKGGKFHFGRQELRHLLDFIYEGEPVTDDEKVHF